MGDPLTVIPTPAELVKDALKQLALEHGWPALKWAWEKVTENQIDQMNPKAKPKASLALPFLIAAVAIDSSKRKRRRR